MLAEKYLDNLDGMFPDDLVKYRRRILRLRKHLQGDDYDTCSLLERYAKVKANAMKARAKGDIKEALRLEAYCDETYRQLPAYARW